MSPFCSQSCSPPFSSAVKQTRLHEGVSKGKGPSGDAGGSGGSSAQQPGESCALAVVFFPFHFSELWGVFFSFFFPTIVVFC